MSCKYIRQSKKSYNFDFIFNFVLLASENMQDSLRMLKQKLDVTLDVGSQCMSALDQSKTIATNLKTNFEYHELDKYMVERVKWARERDAKKLAESTKK